MKGNRSAVRGPSPAMKQSERQVSCAVDASAQRRLVVSVTAGARRNRVVAGKDGVLCVSVKEEPTGGRANERVCALLAEHCGVATSAVHIVKGARLRKKVILVG